MAKDRKKKPTRPVKPAPKPTRTYEQERDRLAAISRDRAAKGQEVGPLPPVLDPERREACRLSFRLFCETYLAERFSLAWSADHITVLDRLETALLRGGLFALAMPRGKLLVEASDELCYPIRRLEGQSGRANGQTLDGAVKGLAGPNGDFQHYPCAHTWRSHASHTQDAEAEGSDVHQDRQQGRAGDV